VGSSEERHRRLLQQYQEFQAYYILSKKHIPLQDCHLKETLTLLAGERTRLDSMFSAGAISISVAMMIHTGFDVFFLMNPEVHHRFLDENIGAVGIVDYFIGSLIFRIKDAWGKN
jgi:hypothetical protein